MGKTRQSADLVSENLVVTDTVNDTIQVGAAVTIYGGSAGIISARKFYGEFVGAGGGSGSITIADDASSSILFPTMADGAGSQSTLKITQNTFKFNASTGDLEIDGSFIGIGSAITGIVTGITAGPGISISQSVGIVTISSTGSGGGSGEFNIGITSSTQIYPLSYPTPYPAVGHDIFDSAPLSDIIVESISASNVSAGNTQVNLILYLENYNGTAVGDPTYIAYNVPIVSGGVVEVLKQPIVLFDQTTSPVNRDFLISWATDYEYIGVNDAIEIYISYRHVPQTDNYFNARKTSVSFGSTDFEDLYSTTTNSAVVQSIVLCNSSDVGDYPASIRIVKNYNSASLASTSIIAKDLIIPRYSTIEICERPKRLDPYSKLQVKVEQPNTINFFASGRTL